MLHMILCYVKIFSRFTFAVHVQCVCVGNIFFLKPGPKPTLGGPGW